RAHDVEQGGGGDAAQRDQSADPHDQGQERDISQREHSFIMFARCSAFNVLADNWSMVEWLPWSADAFARAERERKPVLLSIIAAWCRACHEMDRSTYADPRVAGVIRDSFVPVRVDTDRRPDINDRYNLGGWPTTAFLTPDGRLITGGTFVPLDRMGGV